MIHFDKSVFCGSAKTFADWVLHWSEIEELCYHQQHKQCFFCYLHFACIARSGWSWKVDFIPQNMWDGLMTASFLVVSFFLGLFKKNLCEHTSNNHGLDFLWSLIEASHLSIVYLLTLSTIYNKYKWLRKQRNILFDTSYFLLFMIYVFRPTKISERSMLHFFGPLWI